MITPIINHEIVLKLIKNIDNSEIVFGGSVSDYFLFKKYNASVDFVIKDVDLIVYDLKTLNKIEELFSQDSLFIGLVNNGVYHTHNQYYIKYCGCSIDIFCYDANVFTTMVSKYENYSISHLDLTSRMDILNRAIRQEHALKPMNNVKQMKYVKKLMCYSEIFI